MSQSPLLFSATAALRSPVLVCHVLGRAQVQYEGRKQGMARRSRHKRVGDGLAKWRRKLWGKGGGRGGGRALERCLHHGVLERLRPASHTCRIGAGANVTPGAAEVGCFCVLGRRCGLDAAGLQQRSNRRSFFSRWPKAATPLVSGSAYAAGLGGIAPAVEARGGRPAPRTGGGNARPGQCTRRRRGRGKSSGRHQRA